MLRDATELPYMARWAAGEPMTWNGCKGGAARCREHVRAGRSVRPRAGVVSDAADATTSAGLQHRRPDVEAGRISV